MTKPTIRQLSDLFWDTYLRSGNASEEAIRAIIAAYDPSPRPTLGELLFDCMEDGQRDWSKLGEPYQEFMIDRAHRFLTLAAQHGYITMKEEG
jgi:hypothetical protein